VTNPAPPSRLTRKSVLRALKCWHSPAQLGATPLAGLTIVQARQRADRLPPTAIGRGTALRRVLQEAIERLRPDDGTPNPNEKRWRPYFIIHERFFKRCSVHNLTEQLNIARSTYNHEQAAALDRLLEKLREQESRFRQDNTFAPFLAPPKPPFDLVGRGALLGNLKGRLLSGQNIALLGPPGVGKTALAIALAHDPQVAERFRDGILWARLGRSPDVSAVLAQWAAALGASAGKGDSRAPLAALIDAVHAAIGTQNILLVIDDAWREEDALAFRLGGPNCAHMITTRLPEIAVRFANAGLVRVEELGETDRLRLLSQLAPEVMENTPEKAAELVAETGGLPLSLVLIGNHLRIRALSGENASLNRLYQELRHERERLSLSQAQAPLERQPSLGAEARLSVASVIGISYHALDAAARRAWCALSVIPPKPNTFSEAAALSIADQPPEAIETLLQYGILEPAGPGRYSMHQTLAEFGKLHLEDPRPQERMAAYFVAFVEANEEHHKLLEADLQNVLTALDAAYENEQYHTLARGVNALFHYLQTRGPYSLATSLLQRACQAADHLEDKTALLTTRHNLGRIAILQGDYELAQTHFQQGLALLEAEGPSEMACRLLRGMGVALDYLGHFAEAREFYLKSLEISRQLDDHARLSSTTLLNLGSLAVDLGEMEAAEGYLLEGLALARQAGYRENVIAILNSLGVVAASRGDLRKERALYEEALAVAREVGNRENMAFVLANLGALLRDQGEFEAAEAYLQEGLEHARASGHRERVASLLRNLGELAFERGDFTAAEDYLHEGLALARRIQHARNLCGLHAALGALACKNGDHARAEAHLQTGAALAQESGNRWFAIDILIKRGECEHARQNMDAAERCFQQALREAEEMGEQVLIAEASWGLARAALARKDTPAALRYARKSLEIFSALGHRKARQVKVWMEEVL